MELSLFDEVAEAVHGLAPAELGELHHRSHRYGIKVWFDSRTPPKEHYEAQVIGAQHVPDARTLALEVGFHSEHPDEERNEEVLTSLLGGEDQWRTLLGEEPVAGAFLGGDRSLPWRRISETWPDPDLGDEELGMELALRLVDYLTALEPLRREQSSGGRARTRRARS